MRRTLLVILAFVPAIAAALIFRTWEENKNRDAPGTGAARGVRSDQQGDFHAATGGAETFFIRMGSVEIDGIEREYRGAYYYLGAWKRTAAERFEAQRALVLINPRPRVAADLDDLLVIRNDEDASRRRELLDDAAGRHTSLRAGQAIITGGRSIETADDVRFLDGVVGRVASPPGTLDPMKLSTPTAHVKLDGGRVSAVELENEFALTRSDFELLGAHLVAGDDGHVIVKRSVDLRLGRTDPPREGEGAPGSAWRLTLTAAGPLEYTPRATEENLGALERMRLEGGRLVVTGDVVLRIDDFILHADRMEAVLGPRLEGAARSTRIEDFEMTGHVSIVTPDGEVTGDHATGRLLDDDGLDAVVDGAPVTVKWSAARATLAADEVPRGVHASCRGRLHVIKPARAAVDEPMLIRLEETVTVAVRRGEEIDLDLNCGTLDMKVFRLLANRPGGRPDARAWRLTNAVASGGVNGVSRRSALEAATATLDRLHDQRGLHIRDDLTLESMAVLVLDRGRLTETDEGPPLERSVRVTADDRIVLRRPASPYDDSWFAATGNVHARWEVAGEVRDELEAATMEATVGPGPAGEPGASIGSTRIKSFRAATGVRLTRIGGSVATGDELEFSRERDEITFHGAPAWLEYVDAESREHRFSAPKIRVLRRAGRAMASGGVEAEVVMAAIVLTAEQRAAEKAADRDLDDRPSRDVTWKFRSREVAATFTAGLPLDSRSGETRLREVEITGAVHVENPTQTVDCERLFHDFRTRTGRADGDPVVFTATRVEEEGTWIDRVETRRLTTNPDWTLFNGPCRAVFHVRKDARRGEGFEPLDVTCAEDVLVKERSIFFGGRTHAVRGSPDDVHLELDADSVVVHFAESRPKSSGDVERLEGHGNVAFKWKDLSGSGDLVYFDHTRRRVVLKARDGKCRMLLRGFETSNEMVTYDMDDETITGSRLEGVARESLRKEKR